VSGFSGTTLRQKSSMQAEKLTGGLLNIAPKLCRCIIDCPDGLDNSTCILAENGKLEFYQYDRLYVSDQFNKRFCIQT